MRAASAKIESLLGHSKWQESNSEQVNAAVREQAFVINNLIRLNCVEEDLNPPKKEFEVCNQDGDDTDDTDD